MRLLILGGTRFVGRHLAAVALAAGWEVTLFNRGREDPAAFPDARHLTGDRDGGLDALAAGEWDTVVDTCGYVPRIVRASAELLRDRIGSYVFISSAGVYADKSRAGLTEADALVELDDPRSEDVGAHYDGLKALCEATLRDVLGQSATIIRPGLIVGPDDPTNRFTYWVTRMARGGDVLAPEPRDQAVQIIDVRDLARFVLTIASQQVAGVFNAVGDIGTMERTLAEIASATAGDIRLRWTPERSLLEAGLEPWSDVPLWLAPESDPGYRGFMAISNARAKRAGLVLRPLQETVRDTLDWARAAPPPAGTDISPPAGLDPGVEQRLLAAG
jgi:2'-hydroxyisoflavone reductase